ncbi:hypothetical protein NQ314_001814 [Rhamnusium bicolor]|uniref:Uncharacterized protein n=1 Tax=Rhamnusium bicolor TaxID=1586634 RepID=A0AAV8ZR51_9CUCU|nr:hypothetical protein NQ314_001814 [Rhamnusium bicolor]
MKGEYFVAKEEINYGETVIKYFGRHSCKQFIGGKPITQCQKRDQLQIISEPESSKLGSR